MGKIESYAPGSFCWAELATNDGAAAKRFYGEMFGWTAVDLPMPEGVYTIHIGATYGGPLNKVSWPELATTDPAGAAAFYTRLFGWKTKPETGVETAQYTEWVNGRGDQWKGVPPHWVVYITVADCDERAARAGQLGGKVCVPPTDIPNVGRFSVVSDPQGAVFSIIQMSAMYQPAMA